MKITTSFTKLIALGLLFLSCNSEQTQQISFNQDSAQQVFSHYKGITEALQKGESTAVQQQASELTEALGDSDQALVNLSNELATATSLEAQKEQFASLSNALEHYFQVHISEGTLYKQHCPMALNNQGAFWFSESEQIDNPYFEGGMLRCGTVEGLIKQQ